MRPVRFTILFLLIFLAGCRGFPQRSPLPAAHKVAVGQLVFHSDFELPADHRLVRELVQERDDICNTLNLSCSNEPIEVYLFGDADRYREYLVRNFPSVPSRRAFFLETDTRLAVYAHWSDRVAEDLRHEVAHGYFHSVTPGLPLWVDEGLAEFFEVPRGMNGLNRPHVELLSDMKEHDDWKPNLTRVEKLTDAAEMEQRESMWSRGHGCISYCTPARAACDVDGLFGGYACEGFGGTVIVRAGRVASGPEEPLTQYLATLKKGPMWKEV